MTQIIDGVNQIRFSTRAPRAKWTSSTMIIPENVLCIVIEDGEKRLGDGLKTFSELTPLAGKISDPNNSGGGLDITDGKLTIVTGGNASSKGNVIINGGNASTLFKNNYLAGGAQS